MSEVIAQTERLVLRRWRPDDLKLWLEHLNTDEVTDHLGGPRSPEVTAKRFQEMSEEWDKRGYSFLAAESRSTGMFLGACGLTTIDVPKAPAELRGAVQIGWIFRTEAWGKGYATEAARAVLEIAFGRCGLERVYAQTTERNPPSRAIMEKLGMGRRVDLDYHDPDYPARDNPTIIYAIDNAGWRRFQEISR
jgi:RimJ/RimL family protein N-acetyltransferase